MRRHTTRVLMLGTLLLFMLIVVAPVGAAGSWGVISSEYRGKDVVRASGDLRFSGWDGTNRFNLVDAEFGDGNAVYGKTRWRAAWYPYPVWTDTTPEIEDTNRGFDHVRRGIGSASRVVVIACAQMGWPVPDSCSDWTSINR